MSFLSATDFFNKFKIAYNDCDGNAFKTLLDPSCTRVKMANDAFPSGDMAIHSFLAEFQNYSRTIEALPTNLFSSSTSLIPVLELLVPTTKRLADVLLEEGNDFAFLSFRTLLELMVKMSSFLDSSSDSSEKWRKVAVGCLREIFPKCHRDKTKFVVTCFVSCEILKLYISLDQNSLCSPVLATIKNIYNPNLPVGVSAPLNFYWGKILLEKNELKEACEKFEFAYLNTSNHLCLFYLTPLKLILGSLPTSSHQFPNNPYERIVRSLQSGNLKMFNEEISKHQWIFIKQGIFLLIEKLKFICYWSLVKTIFAENAGNSRLDISSFEKVCEESDGLKKAECYSVLCSLISMGAIKGYLSWEFNKLVLSKAEPFPPIKSWNW
jgi:PCI domain